MKKINRLSHFKTKTEVVYDFLKNNILNGNFKPEEKIVISEVAKQMDVSDIPIREAIKRLQTEGFLDITPHVGASVIKINPEEFEEIALIRGELERLAAKLAVKYLTEKEFNEMERIHKEGELALQNNNFQKLAELNKKFHFKIYNATPHKLLLKMISDLWDKARMLPHVFTYSTERCRQSQKEHKMILDALRKGDGKTAGQIIKKQKIDASNDLYEFMKSEENRQE